MYAQAAAAQASSQAVAYRPPVTTALMGINVGVFALMVLSGVSFFSPSVGDLLKWGANNGALSLGTQPWRMLTSTYVHGGIVHIALNMWCLWNLGKLAERIFDRWTYVLVYTACGIGGSIASLWWHPTVVGVGASGAIFGLAGALIAALYLGRLPVPKRAMQGTLRSLVMFAIYNIVFGTAVPGIDNSAHVGGLITGLAVGAALAPHLTSPLDVRHAWRNWVLIGAALVLSGAFVAVKKAKGYVTPLQSASEAFDRGEYDQAIANSQDVVKHAPDNASAHAVLGASYLQKKQFDKAEQSLKRALELKPRYAFAEYWLGVLYESTDRHEEARKVLSDLVEQQPKLGGGLVLLGYVLEQEHRSDEAIQMYRRAAEADPKDPDAQRRWGNALLKLDKAAEALPHLEEAQKLDTKDADTELSLGKAYAALGRNEEAGNAFKAAKELSSGTDKP